ncbi:MAG: glycosyltransferase [Planctomycetota bacterium]|nr:MAG: glycosyltransferase [Planctomycetota bacterium]
MPGRVRAVDVRRVGCPASLAERARGERSAVVAAVGTTPFVSHREFLSTRAASLFRFVFRNPPVNRSATDKPHVCQVLHSLSVGGAEVLAQRLAEGLASRFRISFVCLDEAGESAESVRAKGFPVQVIGRRPGFDRRCLAALRRHTVENRVDVYLAHQYTPFFYTLLSRRGGSRPPIVFVEHGRFHPDRRSWKHIVVDRLLLRKRDRVLAVGKQVASALVRNEGIPARRIEVVYNGVDTASIAAIGGVRAEVRRELHLDDDAPVAIQVARLDPIKDHMTSLAAFRQVRARFPHARLVIVGDGPQREAIERFIAEHDLEPAVMLLGMRRDVPRLLAAADVFVLSSVSEGIPVTVIEAMAAGLPAVVTNVGGLPEVVTDETGVLVPAGNPQAMGEAVAALFADPARRAALAKAGRERAQRLFDERAMHARYADVLTEVLSGKSHA